MFLRIIHPITFFLALGFSFLVGGQALAARIPPMRQGNKGSDLNNDC
jgi:hypothetical protein